MLDFNLITSIGILLIGILSGFLGATVGGGGLISTPFLIFLGLPSTVAIASDRFGTIGFGIITTIKFWKAKKIQWRYVPILTILGLIGSIIGASILLSIDTELLIKIVGVVLIIFIPIIISKSFLGVIHREPKSWERMLGFLLFFITMIYGGLVGAGTATLVFYIFIFCLGLTLIEANATQAIPWLVLSIVTSLLFAYRGLINYHAGILVFIGMVIGGYLGTNIALLKGNKWIKVFFVIIVIASSVKLLFF